MAGEKLHSTVYVMRDGEVVGYGPDSDDIPEDVARGIGAHAWVDGVHPYPEGDAPQDDGPPAQSGAGASTDAWAKYASANSVTVEDGAARKDIIQACIDAGVPVDKQ